MSYSLRFNLKAKKEWDKLDHSIKEPFKKKLEERLKAPVIPASAISGAKDCYKIKLRAAGYRLVYQVIEEEVVVLVLAVGKRERNAVYRAAMERHGGE